MLKFFRCIIIIALSLLTVDSSNAGDAQNTVGLNTTELFPQANFSDQIQSPEQYFKFKLGSKHLLHYQVVQYCEYLAEASEHVRLIPYAESHGGRPLQVLMVTRNADSLDLQQLQQQRRELTQGTTDSNQATAKDTKTLAYIGYTIHGDEASGLNAFPAVAYYLAAGSDDLRETTLDQSILLLDPCLNPDGSDRFANWVNDNRGRYPSDFDGDREHSQPWPRGRTNYYWFDLNRDWLPTSHPESKGRIELFHQMKPNLLLDFHEMGSTSSYFFQPGIPERNNPLTPDSVFQLTRKFAAKHAKSMDAASELYFTEERFDDFYMGKGSTYPDLHGAIGILFEQGSTRGLLSSNDRYTRSFSDTVANQVRTTISSLRALKAERDALISHQASFYSQALEMAEASPIKAYILHANDDHSRISAAADLLQRHDIQYWVPNSNITVDGQQLESGSALIIPTMQPEYRFLQSLMNTQQSFPENIFYDVSAWTLPLAFDLHTIEFQSDIPESWKNEANDSSVESVVSATSEDVLAYAIDPVSLSAPKLLARLMQDEIEIRVAYDPFTAKVSESDTQNFRRGTWIVAKATNASAWERANEILSTTTNVDDIIVTPLVSGLSPTGPDLGSDANKVIPTAKVLLVVGDGTSSLDAGAIWHFLDHRFQLPTTRVDVDSLSRVDLSEYSCVILPDGSYQTLSSSGTNALESYVNGGGTIIALQSAIQVMQSKGLVSKHEDSSDTADGNTTSIRQPKNFAEASDVSALEGVAGAIFAVTIDETHPLAFGFPDTMVPVFRDSSQVYAVPKNYLTTAAKYDSVLAGYVSQRNRARISESAAIWGENKGSGRIICLADNPVFRGYFRGSERFLTNAILLGPTLRIPSLVD